jgi:hypothetical protein
MFLEKIFRYIKSVSTFKEYDFKEDKIRKKKYEQEQHGDVYI